MVLTRTDIDLLALRSMFDLPFYLLIFGAARSSCDARSCGWPVLALLALAGLLRPEAWLLARRVLALARARSPRGRSSSASPRSWSSRRSSGCSAT